MLNLRCYRTALDARLLAGNFMQVFPIESSSLAHCIVQYSFRCCHAPYLGHHPSIPPL